MEFFFWKLVYSFYGMVKGIFPFLLIFWFFSEKIDEKNFVTDLFIRFIFLSFILISLSPDFSENEIEQLKQCTIWSDHSSIGDPNKFRGYNVCIKTEKYVIECLKWDYNSIEYEDRFGMQEVSEAFCLEYEDEGKWITEFKNEEDIRQQIYETIMKRFNIITFWMSLSFCLIHFFNKLNLTDRKR